MSTATPDRTETRLELKVHGLDCAEEVAILKRAVGPVVGGEAHLGFDVLRGKMTVRGGNGISAGEVRQAVARTGMRAEPWRDARPEEEGFWRRHGRMVSVAASGVLAATGFAVHALLAGDLLAALAGEGVPLSARVLYLLAMAAGGWFVLPKAWHAARSLRPDMNLLMTVAVTGAVGIGEWLEAAAVAFLFGLSIVLEGWSVGRARHAVEALLDLSPATARVREDGTERELPAAEVEPGSLFVVRPGERLPLDGEVVAGESHVDQAPITGESLPIEKHTGDKVTGGTVNSTGSFVMEAERVGSDGGGIAVADVNVLTMQLNVPSAKNAERYVGAIRRGGVESGRVRIAVNRYVKKGWDIDPAEVERALGLKLSWTIPNDYKNAIAAAAMPA